MSDVASLARQKYNDALPSYGHREVLDWYGYLALCDALEERAQEVERLRDASRGLLELMTDYYFHARDPELEAVNRLRRLVGMRDQLPKHLEAELQADEAEAASEARRGVPQAKPEERD